LCVHAGERQSVCLCGRQPERENAEAKVIVLCVKRERPRVTE